MDTHIYTLWILRWCCNWELTPAGRVVSGFRQELIDIMDRLKIPAELLPQRMAFDDKSEEKTTLETRTDYFRDLGNKGQVIELFHVDFGHHFWLFWIRHDLPIPPMHSHASQMIVQNGSRGLPPWMDTGRFFGHTCYAVRLVAVHSS